MSHDLQGEELNTGTDLFSIQQTPVKLEHGTDEAFVNGESLQERTSDSGNSSVTLDHIKTEITEICLISDSKIKTIPICDEVNYLPPVPIPLSGEGTSNGPDRATYRLFLGKTIEYKYKQKLDNDYIKQYHCPNCEHVTSSIPHLKKHLKGKHLSDILFCDECQMLFMGENNLKEHKRIRHGGKEWKCGKCNFRTFQYRCIIRHREKHLRILFQCVECNQKFLTRSQQQCHMEKKHLEIFSDSETYKCNICNVKFLHRSYLDRHNWKHFGIRPYSCKLCDFKSGFPKSVSRHMLLKHTYLTKLRCSSCFKKFYDEKSLREHEECHLVRQCPICPHKTSSWLQLTKHIKETHQKDKKVKWISCNKCFRKLASPRGLSRHLADHCPLRQGAQKQLQCNKCFSRLSTNASLDRHLATTCKVLLKKEPVKPHQCAICLMRYASVASLKHHLKGKHGKLLCSKCSETFTNPSELDHHLKNSTCTQSQRYVASIVDKAKIPNQINEYKCPACNEQFPKYKVLKRHSQLCVFR